jgi:hypothetical protein
MYNDYDVVYKSNLNEFLAVWIVLGIFALIALILTIISLSKVFKKANHSGIAPWIPIYNIYLLVEIANLPLLYFILSLIPFANIYAMYKVSMSMAKLFKKSEMFGYGLFFLPFVFYPILAFSDSEYIGINLFALQGTTTVEDIPIIDENKNKEIEIEVNDNVDVSSKNINISIGGGKYQKDYTANLVDVDRNKIVNKVIAEKEIKKDTTNNVFIKDPINNQETPEPIQEKKSDDLFNVPFINTEVKQEQEEKPNPVINTINAAVNRNSEDTKGRVMPNVNGEYKLCPNCGTRVNETSKICFICGQKLQ